MGPKAKEKWEGGGREFEFYIKLEKLRDSVKTVLNIILWLSDCKAIGTRKSKF